MISLIGLNIIYSFIVNHSNIDLPFIDFLIRKDRDGKISILQLLSIHMCGQGVYLT